jgi:dTDP-glucose 4,6-dehydratase
MKTILITGGAGFIGSNFVRHLFTKYPNYRIVVVDSLTYAGSVQNFPDGAFESDRYEFWYGDVRNGELMDTLVSQADIVVHMAAESHVTRSIYDNRLFFETDVLGTQTVANAVAKYRHEVERFIHISTSEVYGTALKDAIDEDHPLNPMSPYAAAKCGADRLVYSYWTTYKIPAVIIRPFNNFGPYQHLEKLVPRFITSLLLGEPMTVHGDGSAARDWLFVEDHCDALDKVMHADLDKIVGETINIGTGTHRNILEIADAIENVMSRMDGRVLAARSGSSRGSSVSIANKEAATASEATQLSSTKVKYIGDRPGQVFRHTCNFSKAKELLGWEPSTSFEDGITKTIEWYQNNREWWSRQMWMRHIPIVTASGKREMH